MKTKTSIFFILSFTVLYILTGCNLSEPTIDNNQVSTIVALTRTIIAQSASSTPVQTPTLIPQTTENVQKPATSTNTIQPSITPPPTSTETPAGPTPTPDCTDKASFVSETIKDGTPFSPGEKFIKKWVLKNTGTCTWGTNYSLVFVDGIEMNAQNPQPFQIEVQPGNTAEFSNTFTAPNQTGTYRSNWMLKNNRNETFGLGKNSSDPFWVEISVIETGTGLDLGTPDWIDTFDKTSSSFSLGEYADTEFSIENGYLKMKSIKPAGDQWRMANRPALGDFFLEAVFLTGKECSGKDSYGFIIRSPDSGNTIVDTGYVFGFSCDGQYRFYRNDKGTYTGIQNWTTALNLKTGPNQENRLGILAVGDSLKIYINDVMVAEFLDSNYLKGTFGLMVRSMDTAGLEIFVDQIATWNVP